ncbi:hypothetical protein GGS21DRAFT_372859 [Xylaria nigripes]|nr:hypothetical protein GGS21DRAFT_372859 [Xylaria nigripes]
MDIESILPQLQDTLSQIQSAISDLSAKKQHDEIEQLEQARDHLLADIRARYEREQQDISKRRQSELETIRQKRKQEDEKREARRRKEDEEWKMATANEDTQRRQKRDSEASTIEHKTTRQIDELEGAARKAMQDGKQKLQELDEKRKELNRLVDEQLAQPLQPSSARKRHRSKPKPGDSSKDEVTGNSAPACAKDGVSSPKANNTPDTSSKNQTTSSAGSPAKTLDAKSDGELPFQPRPNNTPQAAKESVGNMPVSFAGAVKNNVSNGSKDKLKLEKHSSSDRPGQNGDLGDTRGGDVAEPVETRKTKEDNKFENGKASEGIPASERQDREVTREKPTVFQPVQNTRESSRGRENDVPLEHSESPEAASKQDSSQLRQSGEEVFTIHRLDLSPLDYHLHLKKEPRGKIVRHTVKWSAIDQRYRICQDGTTRDFVGARAET